MPTARLTGTPAQLAAGCESHRCAGPQTTLKLVAGSEDPELLAAASEYWSSLLGHTSEIVRRAQRRGAASVDVDPVETIESLLGPIYLRLLVTQRPITARDLERLADRIARQLERPLTGHLRA
jgi:hypothetical protein